MRLVVWLLLAVGRQDDAVDAKIGDAPAHLPVGCRLMLHCAPTMDRTIGSYLLGDREVFLLENGAEEPGVLKWIGWKMPERASVVLAGAEERRRLLVGGIEEKRLGEVWDAALLDGGRLLAVVVRADGGMVLKAGERTIGPFPRIDLLRADADRLAYVAQTGDRARLVVGDRAFDAVGRPRQIFVSPDGASVAWIEELSDRRQQAVVDGRRGAAGRSIHHGIHFSPNGRHVAYVTREEKGFRGWADGAEVRSERSVVAARVLDDGTVVAVETWSEPGRSGPEARGRLVVRGAPQERILPRPVYDFVLHGASLFGVARSEERSVIVRIGPSGDVAYEETPGRIGTLLPEPGGKRRAFTVATKAGLFVQIDEARIGPFERADLFHLRFTGRFGYVAQKKSGVVFGIERQSTQLALTEYVSPIAVTRTEMTAIVAGFLAQNRKKEIWRRVVALE
ncbi:MAG: hypothetical protein HYY17_10160 [Planctomycetes bacterium]|nr:hypothetical protein [Planctomycetota bacterium]